MNIERLKLVQELVLLAAEVKDAPKLERIKKAGRIIAILKMLGTSVSEASPGEDTEGAAPVEGWKNWPEDRAVLQSIVDGKHKDMRLPALYDAIAAIDARQKDNPEYPEMLEKALDAWQKVILDMTAKIAA